MKKKLLLIATLGHPGSGKTYFSEHLSKEYNLVHLSRDKFRQEAIHNPTYAVEEQNAISQAINWLTCEFLSKGVGVINDGNYTKKKYRTILSKIAKKYDCTYILVHIITPVETARKRVVKRINIKSKEKKKYYRPIDTSLIDFIINDTEYPTKSEPVIEIDGSKPFTTQLSIFKKGLKKYLS